MADIEIYAIEILEEGIVLMKQKRNFQYNSSPLKTYCNYRPTFTCLMQWSTTSQRVGSKEEAGTRQLHEICTCV